MEEETPPASATSTLKENLWGVCSYASLNGIGAKAACTAPDGSGRPVVGRSVVARASAGPGLIAEHFTRLAKERLDALSPVGWAWRSLGGVGRRDGIGPTSGVERMPPTMES